jgi:UDP-glucuronate 4-epimerase
VPEFISYIEKGLGKAAVKRDMEAHSAELPITFADTSHAEEVLNYEPQVSVEKGVHHFIEWYRWYQETGVKTDFPTKDFYLPKKNRSLGQK